MNKGAHPARGYTLIELVVVIMIIMILAVIAIVQYMKSVEANRADQALSLVQQVAAANSMYRMDNAVPPTYTDSNAAGKAITDLCNAASCPGAPSNDPCNLVACNYLSKRDWDCLPYNVYSLSPGLAFGICGSGFPAGSQFVACAKRKVRPSPGSCPNDPGVASGSAYANWGYIVSTGSVVAVGGAPSPNP